MINQLTLLIFFFTVLQFHAQEKRIVISGKINSDALSVENIHIINKNSGKATISNQYGEFKIPVKMNDTIMLSGIQFYKKEITITKQLIKKKLITIELFQKINELDEVELKAHNLSGNLVTDADSVKDSVSKVNSLALDFSMIDFSKPVILDIDEFSRSRTSSDEQLTPPSGDILGLLSFILNPLFKEVSKIGTLRRKRKNEERVHQKKIINTPEKIITELGETFFTETLKIPREEITSFISHCKSKGIIDLYIKNRKMEVIDILIKESKIYRSKFKE